MLSILAVVRRPFVLALAWGAVAFLLLPSIQVVAPLGMFSRGASYLAPHSIMEGFACGVSLLIFAVGWHAVHDERSGHMAVLSASFFAVGVLDFAHLLSFPGMPAFITPSSTEKGIAFWLAARYAGGAGLLGLALLPIRWRIGTTTRFLLLSASAAYVALTLWLVLYRFELLPRTFVPGSGLTHFKIAAEYGLVALHLAVAAIFILRRRSFEGIRSALLVAAALTLAASELPFTLYAAASDAYNFAGHIYKVIGFGILYWAVFVDTVIEPYRRRKESEALYKQLSDQATVAIFKLNGDGRVVTANPSAGALAGRAGAALLEHPFAEFLSEADAARLEARAADTPKGAAANFFAHFARADNGGGPVPVEIGISALDDGGRLMIVRDMSEQKRAEAELIALKDRAEEANRAKSEFLANMSHELRTPLNAVLGFSELIAKETLGPVGTERYRDYARDIHASGAHLLALVSQLLDLARIEAGRWKLADETVSLQDLITDLVRISEPGAHAAGAHIVLALDTQVPSLRADAQSIRQILFNLLGNAIKFSPPGGSVTVSLARIRNGITLAVADQGPGIAKDDIARLGRPFVQLESAYQRTYGGSGLGLAIVRGLVELLGGRLSIDSALGKGTRVTVELPLDRLAAEPLSA